MLDERYARISRQLDSLLKETKNDSSVKSKKLKTNICNINVIDLERILSTMNTSIDVSSDIFFKSIRPVVKTALTTASVWNYILETPLRSIKSIRSIETDIKDQLAELYELKTLVEDQVVYVLYLILFLIKNRAELRVGDLSNMLSASVSLIGVISDLSQNCPLVKNVLDKFLSDEVIESLSDIETYINDNLNDTVYSAEVSKFNSGYVDKVINIYGKLEGSGLNYNYDNYTEQMIDFLNQTSNMLTRFLTHIDSYIDILEATVTDSADSIVNFIRDLGIDEYLVSIAGLERCLSIIKKYDYKNAKEYNSYYKKLSKIPKVLDIVSIDNNIYTMNKAKLQLLIIKYYTYKRQEYNYNTLTGLIENLDCITETLQDKPKYTQKDQLRIRNFTFFAVYYYGANIIMEFLKQKIDSNEIINSDSFNSYIDFETSNYIDEITRVYNTELSTFDSRIVNSVQVVFDAFPNLSNDEKVAIIDEAKKNNLNEYDKMKQGFQNNLKSARDFNVSKFIGDPSLISDINVRNEVLANSSIVGDLTTVYNQLLKYYFQDNLAEIMDKLTKREFRDVIDNITTVCTSDKGELYFFNNVMLVDIFGEGNGIIYEMDFEQQLNAFINNTDGDTTVTPSLRFMVNRYKAKIKNAKSTYNTNFTLDEKLQDIVDRHYSDWRNFNAQDILKEYLSIVRNLENDSTIFDPNGIKNSLQYLKDLFIESFDIEQSTSQYDIQSQVYNVAKIEQFFNDISLIVNENI